MVDCLLSADLVTLLVTLLLTLVLVMIATMVFVLVVQHQIHKHLQVRRPTSCHLQQQPGEATTQ